MAKANTHAHTDPYRPDLTAEQAAHYLNQLREARATALGDAEGFGALFQAIESLGRYLAGGKGKGLGDYCDDLRKLAAFNLSENWAVKHFDPVFTLAKEARNSAVHEGAYARIITQHAVDLALLLEESLMQLTPLAKHFMIGHPMTVAAWQTLREARQLMLRNSFSYLPIQYEGKWQLLADYKLVEFMQAHCVTHGGTRRQRDERDAVLNQRIEVATKSNDQFLELTSCESIGPDEPIPAGVCQAPILVVENGTLLGLISPFDRL